MLKNKKKSESENGDYFFFCREVNFPVQSEIKEVGENTLLIPPKSFPCIYFSDQGLLTDQTKKSVRQS